MPVQTDTVAVIFKFEMRLKVIFYEYYSHSLYGTSIMWCSYHKQKKPINYWKSICVKHDKWFLIFVNFLK